jgi:hypothetical protein
MKSDLCCTRAGQVGLFSALGVARGLFTFKELPSGQFLFIWDCLRLFRQKLASHIPFAILGCPR